MCVFIKLYITAQSGPCVLRIIKGSGLIHHSCSLIYAVANPVRGLLFMEPSIEFYHVVLSKKRETGACLDKC